MDAPDPTPSHNHANSDAGGHDEPYRFGRRPTARAPFPFTERQFARLLIVRGRIQAAPSAWDDVEAA
jgi:hypothetical protein